MKSLFISLFSISAGLANLFTMDNFNPVTLNFWTTLIGTLVLCIIAGFIGLAFSDVIEKIKDKWTGTGRTHSKDLSPQR